ncbi:hypothetical protein ACH4F6_01545 [Streptomyces sp. NPDC017936]|uniref:hypothetical protein n=1 Tax=Streptomyces sp. NPDC017936 TaxID=3365016 RepID=UPI0037904343
MRKLVYYIGVTLDGRIAGPVGEHGFFPLGDARQTAAYAAWTNTLYPETVPTAHRAVFDVAERTAFPDGVTLTRLTRRRAVPHEGGGAGAAA